MRVLVLGASGGTGREMVEQALSHGHVVTAFVHKRPLEITDADLTVVHGDVLEFVDVSSAMLGQDAVLSALSHGRGEKGKVLSDGIGNVIHAMATYRVNKLVAVSAAGTFDRGNKNLSLGYRALLGTTMRGVYDELEAMERRIMASDLDWTIVRPFGLTNGPLTGEYRVSLEGAVLPRARSISRADVAALALKALRGDTYSRRPVTIAY